MTKHEEKNRFAFVEWLRTTFFIDIRDFANSLNWFRLKNPQWADVSLGGIVLEAGASAPDIITISTSDIKVRAFAGLAITEELSGNFKLNSNYKEGTDIILHCHWMPTNNNAGNVKWWIEYIWLNNNDIFSSSTSISVIQATGGVAWKSLEADFVAVSGTGKKIGSIIDFKVYRIPGGEDTYSSDAALRDVGIHYQINSFGSRSIDAK